MKQIWKYTLEARESQRINIPFGGKILSAKSQNDNIVIYALVDPDKKEMFMNYEFRVYGTGHDININIDEYTFLNTVNVNELMFHVFYKI